MIKVTIELISAITRQTSELGRMYIANDGKGTAERGNYNVAVCRKGRFNELINIATGAGAARHGKVINYPRAAYNAWRLITRACIAAFPEERATTHSSYSHLPDNVARGMVSLSQRELTQDEIDALYWVTFTMRTPDEDETP